VWRLSLQAVIVVFFPGSHLCRA